MQFEQPAIAIETQFWFKLVEVKLNELKLDESWLKFFGFYNLGINRIDRNSNSVISMPSKIFIEGNAIKNLTNSQLKSSIEISKEENSIPALTLFKNFNIIDDFKKCDKQEIMYTTAKKVLF